MNPDDIQPLPWETLTTAGDVPWATLEQFATAAAGDPSVLEQLLDLFDEWREADYQEPRFEGLCVLGILALAADRLAGECRDRAVRFLVRAQMDAGEDGDDFLLDALPAATGRFRPDTVLPIVLEFMPEDFSPWYVAYELWQLAVLAADSRDEDLRQRVVDLCTKALSQAQTGHTDMAHAESAARVLARMGHRQSRPLIEGLHGQTGDPDLQDALALLDDPTTEWPPDPWEQPVRDWIQGAWQQLATWYAEIDPGDPDSEEGQTRAAYNRASHLARRFSRSDLLKPQPRDLRQYAEFLAYRLMMGAWTYCKARPEDIDESVLRKLLLDVLPAQKADEGGFFDDVILRTVDLLRWLEGEGILHDTQPLQEAVREWQPQIKARAADPTYWGEAKRARMGMDLPETASTGRTAPILRNKAAADQRLDRLEPSAPATRTSPIVNSQGKIGRNDPCPCGSGRKYKKCCGKG